MDPLTLNFQIRSAYNHLSSKRMFYGRKKAILLVLHVMRNHKHYSMSPTPVNGRYTWKYNRVLKELVKYIKNYMKSEPTISILKFISERSRIYAGFKQTIKHRAVPCQNFLGSSGDWEVSADRPGWHNNYPKTITSKGLRPETVLLLRVNLKIIVLELPIPYESQMAQSHEHKTSKSEDLKKGEKRKSTAWSWKLEK